MVLTSLEAYEDGVLVYKPKTTFGKSIANYSAIGIVDFDSDGNCIELSPESDAVPIVFTHANNEWHVFCNRGVGGPAPGDFYNIWKTAEKAITDIRKYFFE